VAAGEDATSLSKARVELLTIAAFLPLFLDRSLHSMLPIPLDFSVCSCACEFCLVVLLGALASARVLRKSDRIAKIELIV
jgi:hypothetical protein